MICTWSDEEEDEDDESSLEDESDGKLCLMTKGEEEDNEKGNFAF